MNYSYVIKIKCIILLFYIYEKLLSVIHVKQLCVNIYICI